MPGNGQAAALQQQGGLFRAGNDAIRLRAEDHETGPVVDAQHFHGQIHAGAVIEQKLVKPCAAFDEMHGKSPFCPAVLKFPAIQQSGAVLPPRFQRQPRFRRGERPSPAGGTAPRGRRPVGPSLFRCRRNSLAAHGSGGVKPAGRKQGPGRQIFSGARRSNRCCLQAPRFIKNSLVV